MRFLFPVIALTFMMSCAQPRYADEAPTSRNLNHDSGSVAECAAQFKTSQACVTWSWEQMPTEDAPGSLTFKIYRLNTLDQTPVLIDLEGTATLVLWMPSMGHGSTPARVQRIDTGTYRATNVHFVMPGDWEFRFQMKQGNTVLDEAIVSLLI